MIEEKKQQEKETYKVMNEALADGYKSRRQRNYDDDQSQDSEDVDYVQSEVPELNYQNTQG
jgi:hypothetical protein